LTDFQFFIEAFEAYTAELNIHEYTLHQFDEKQNFYKTKGDIRKAVFRVPPVSFYDRLLCQKAFNLEPEEIVGRLQDHVEKVYYHHDGVVVVYSSKPVTKEVYLSVNDIIKSLLK